MKKHMRSSFALAIVLLLLTVGASSAIAAGPVVFINEIHYDNTGGDTGEAVEIAGPAGTNLAGWSVVLYNGNNGADYNTIALSGTIPNQQAGFGTLSFAQAGIQNGSPDGLALVDAGSSVVEFLSYEGSFAAVGGAADGMSSTDIGVSESGGSPVGNSLQVIGTGTEGGDFTWASTKPNTFGAVNSGQTFGTVTSPTDPIINEFVADHTSSDTNAFVEVLGDPSTDYSAFSVLEIEGDSSGAGIVDAVLPLTTTNTAGYWIDLEDMENGTITILLVESFSGSKGNDLDTNNDGTLDATPWTRIVDDVATTDGGGSDRTYSSTVLAPGFGGSGFQPGGASRIPNGTDSDTTGDWLLNDFHGFGFPGFPGSPALGEAENTPDAVNIAISVLTDPLGDCGDSATLIHDIQGSGLASGDVGSIREIEGVVVGDFESGAELSGFFVQEEDSDADGDTLTSEGIFVFNNGFGPGVASGDVVRVRGSVTEFSDLTEINNVTKVLNCTADESTVGSATSATVTLPVASLSVWETVEGMSVTIPQTLYATDTFNQGRFGEVILSIGSRQDIPTNVVAPGAAANALQDLNSRSRIQLDDGSSVQNPLPLPPYIGTGGTLRIGDTIPSLTGVLGEAFGSYEMHPTTTVSFIRVNTRNASPPSVGGTLKVASFNVLNYFSTIDTGPDICGPLADQDCRGADTASEFTRQRDKIIDAIVTMDADVIGLMEIENHATDAAVTDLVNGLNVAAGAGTYAAISTGPIGDDVIKVGLIYQPADVSPAGAFAVLDSSVNPAFNDDKNRPALAQTFEENGTGARFTAVVNHLKSKGSSCADIGDPDLDDGQGNCNLTRTSAAVAESAWLATDPTGSGDPDFLIMGDLNSYAQEDPIVAIEGAGFTDLVESFVGTGADTFVFIGQAGYLDHALANASMLPDVTGTAIWHINADEPRALDYNNFNQPILYNADPFRASDHDPVLIGLDQNPCRALEPIIDSLQAIIDANPGTSLEDKIEDVLDKTEVAYEECSKTPPDNQAALGNIEGAVGDLEAAVDDGLLDAGQGTQLMDQLTATARAFAADATNLAIAQGGDPGDISDAQQSLADGDALRLSAEFKDAVNKYKDALSKAEGAL